MNKTERFVIEKAIAEGGFGEVWKAYDRESKQYVALKRVKLGQSDTPTNFKNEICIMSMIK